MADLISAFQYVKNRNARAARATRSAVRQAIRSLDQFSNRGRPSRITGLREIVVRGTPYVVVYRVEADLVTVLRIRHSSQDPSP